MPISRQNPYDLVDAPLIVGARCLLFFLQALQGCLAGYGIDHIPDPAIGILQCCLGDPVEQRVLVVHPPETTHKFFHQFTFSPN